MVPSACRTVIQMQLGCPSALTMVNFLTAWRLRLGKVKLVIIWPSYINKLHVMMAHLVATKSVMHCLGRGLRMCSP